jgi:NAD(P)-dependent dehydrogenase (short-subunit alcohol dehydrogenase family)
VKKLVDLAVQTYGRIDVMLNNAGLMPHSPPRDRHPRQHALSVLGTEQSRDRGADAEVSEGEGLGLT